jgi:hypothetical protein
VRLVRGCNLAHPWRRVPKPHSIVRASVTYGQGEYVCKPNFQKKRIHGRKKKRADRRLYRRLFMRMILDVLRFVAP